MSEGKDKAPQMLEGISAIAVDAMDTIIEREIKLPDACQSVFGVHDIKISLDRIESALDMMNKHAALILSENDDKLSDEEFCQKINIDKYLFLCSLLGIEDDARQIAAELQGIYNTSAGWQLIDGTREALEMFRGQGYELALISNFTKNLRDILEGLNIAHLFSVILLSCEEGLSKPDAQIFKRAADALSLPCERILYIGDSTLYDVEGARSAGCRAVLFDKTTMKWGDIIEGFKAYDGV
jgi:HAD superfamily hydrolase (TIGR01549 family)